MSQVTRCPSCETRFKVVADQLRISQGWVRCGKCQCVFDATQDLQHVPDELLQAALQKAAATGAFSAPGTAAPVHDAASAPERPAQAKGTHSIPAAAPVASAEPLLENPELIAPSQDESMAGWQFRADFMPVQATQDADRYSAQQAEHFERDVLQTGLDEPKEHEPRGQDDPATPLLSEWLHEADDDLPPLKAAEPEADLARETGQGAGPDWMEAEAEAAAGAETSAEPAQEPSDDALGVISAEDDAPSESATQTHAEPQAEAQDETQDSTQDAPHTAAQSAANFAAEAGHEPGFVRRARRQAFWQSRSVRATLWLGCVLAAAVMLGQYALHKRDTLAAHYPALAPALKRACQALGCEVQARRQIADVAITGSGFQQLAKAHHYQWSLTLENRSAAPLATPMAELTLTDAKDQPLLRRAVDLRSLGAPAVLQPFEEWSVQVPVQVQELSESIAGYRALVFYP